ncbi:MAG TPA: acyltransferase [Caulobacterales bacterium]|nr:acyltransferase [Caulobacterales bacterium]
MPRFSEIEGLRAWLAWTVVLGHLVEVLHITFLDADARAHVTGAAAVEVFVLISGFVITGLLLDREESWARFIMRRAFRLYPVYLFALALGAIAVPAGLAALGRAPWGQDQGSFWYVALSGETESLARWPWAHWLLHLSLLQGAIPNGILPWSSETLVAPAWSLSLEWQFYLLAPAIVSAVRKPRGAVIVAALAFGLALLFQRGAFGDYESYTSLLGGLWLFLIGIASRLALPAIKRMDLPPTPLAISAIGLGLVQPGAAPLGIWAALLIFMARDESKATAVSACARVVLQSPLATALGARSYSVYIIHVPIMLIILSLLPTETLTRAQTMLVLGPFTILCVLLLSELLYRLLERPMIRLGARLTAGSAAVETPLSGAAQSRPG